MNVCWPVSGIYQDRDMDVQMLRTNIDTLVTVLGNLVDDNGWYKGGGTRTMTWSGFAVGLASWDSKFHCVAPRKRPYLQLSWEVACGMAAFVVSLLFGECDVQKKCKNKTKRLFSGGCDDPIGVDWHSCDILEWHYYIVNYKFV